MRVDANYGVPNSIQERFTRPHASRAPVLLEGLRHFPGKETRTRAVMWDISRDYLVAFCNGSSALEMGHGTDWGGPLHLFTNWSLHDLRINNGVIHDGQLMSYDIINQVDM
jgi:hypothetical protein